MDLSRTLTQLEEEMEEVFSDHLTSQSAFLSMASSAAPNDKMKDVLKRTVSEAKSATSKVCYQVSTWDDGRDTFHHDSFRLRQKSV